METKVSNRKIIALVALILSSPFWLMAQEDGTIIDKLIGVIGDKAILKSDLESQIVSIRAQGVLIDDNTRCDLLNDLLFQKLLINQAGIDSVTVSNDEVEGEIDRRMSYFIAQIGSEKKLEQYYKKSIHEIKEEFRTIVKDQMIGQRMQGQITSSVKVTPSEVSTYFKALPEDSIPTIESEVEYAQILINAKESEAEKDVARARIEGFRKRIIEGEDFSTLAILYSDDQVSAKNGGDLGFLGRAELVPEFSITAFKLKNKAVSEVVETEFGYHIMELIERRGQKVNVRHILVKVKIGEAQIQKAKLLADSVYNLLETDTLTYEELVDKYSDDDQSNKNKGLVVNAQSGTSIFTIDQLNPQVFYTIDKMNPGEVYQPVPAEDQEEKKGYRIIKLITKTDPHKASFDDDYAKIQNLALAEKRNIETKKWVTRILGQTYIKLDKEYHDCKFQYNWIK